MSSNELYHYGVKGMRWGHHKAYSKSFDRAANGNHGTYSLSKKHRQASAERWKQTYNDARRVNKAETDLKRAKTALKKAKQISTAEWKQKRKDYYTGEGTGKKVAKFILAGPAGAYTYNSLRATGHGRALSAGVTVCSSLIAGPLGNIAVSTIVGSDYRDGKL